MCVCVCVCVCVCEEGVLVTVYDNSEDKSFNIKKKCLVLKIQEQSGTV